MDTSNYPLCNITQLRELVLDAALMAQMGARPRPTLVLSPPGSGKSETGALITAILNTLPNPWGSPYQFVPLEGGLTVPEEIGGVPVRDEKSGGVIRFPLGPIKTACSFPSVLLLDEVTRCDSTRQGAFMTGVNERRFGDWHLHPGTVVMLAGNEPDSGGVFSLLDALLNRCCVVRLRTEREEIRNYLRGAFNTVPQLPALPVDAPQRFASERARLTGLWADYSEGRSEMISEEPPKGFSETGALWPSGRAVVHACERLAARSARGASVSDEVALTHVSGTVGREIGVLWHRLNELAGKLPSIAEINANPAAARVPPDVESAIASLGMLPHIGNNALWVYLSRYDDRFAEIKAAATKRCQGKIPTDTGAPLQAFNKLLARVHNAIKPR
ncbi:MAG: MoxR family ATPase [Minisyncoccia bacterium]